MKSPQTPAKSRQTTTGLQIKTQDKGRAARSKKSTARNVFLMLLLLAAVALAALPGSSSATGKRAARADAAPTAPEVTRAKVVSRDAGRVTPTVASPASFAPLVFFDPPIATYADDCTTPSDSFNLGDTVCVKVSGAPASGAAVFFSDPDNSLRQVNAISPTAVSYTFALPTDPTTGDTDNRGSWAAAVVNTDDNSRRAVARFFVHDPAHQVADVTISKVALDISQAVAGSNVSYRVFVTNQGPDAATNASFTDNTLPNTTFVSFTDDGTSGFSCTPPTVGSAGSTVCTKASMANGETASFTAVYKLSGSIANGSDLTDTATISSGTTDSHPSSNSSTTDTTVSNTTTPTCSLTCPNNVAAVADTVEGGVSGTHVTLPAAASSGSTCGTVTSSIASGSFFPVGSTPVTYTASDGTSCEFLVIVTGSGSPVSISCPASVTANADADCQVPVALGTPATTGDNVVVYGTRSDGKPISAQFTSGITTVTWTAIGFTDAASASAAQTAIANGDDPEDPNSTALRDALTHSTGTATCTQAVTIVDVTPPVINVPNPAPVSADANCQAVIPDLTGSTGITDNCACDSSDSTEACAGHSRVAVTQSPAPGTLVGLGNTTITLTANDGSASNGGAGNTTTAQVTFTVVDTTPPAISCPANITVYLPLNTTATSMPVSYPAATASDNCGSPTISYSKASGSVFNVGTTTVTATADDGHGNTASCSFTVTVLYDFTGFFQPVGNPPTLNVVNAGRAVPVKFSLSGNKGLSIFAANSPQSGVIPCDASAPAVDLTDTVTAGGSSLSYDSGSDQYIYTWKTDSSWAGTCRQLQVTLNDGSVHTALFKFR